MFSLLKTRFFLVTGSLIFSLLAMESFVRLQTVYLGWKYKSQEEQLGRYDSRLGWVQRANTTIVFASEQYRFKALCRTNSRGLRDEEYAYEKSPGVLRILLLGDSRTVGLEVDKRKVIDSVLERLIRQKRPAEVINAAVRGYGTDQSYLFLKHEGLKYDPDIILYIFSGNDPVDNITIYRPPRYGKPYFFLKNGRASLRGVPVPQSFTSDRWLMSSKKAEEWYNPSEAGEAEEDNQSGFFLRAGRELAEHSRLYCFIQSKVKSSGRQTRSIPGDILRYQWDITEAILKTMQATCRHKKIRFAVFGASDGSMQSARMSKFEEMAHGLKIESIESKGSFFERSKGKPLLIYPVDGHWNAKGHQFAAELIYRHLEKIGWL